MAIRELNDRNFTAGYTRPRFGSKESEQDWFDLCKKDKQSQKVTSCVTRGCTVETVMETTLREFEPATAADVGGHGNLERLKRVGAVSVISERESRTNRGEFAYRIVDGKAVTHAGQIFTGGFNGSELDIPAEAPVQRIDDRGRVVMTQGRPAVDGNELAEDLIKRGLARRARILDSVVAAGKKALKRETKTDGK